jgi:hypothetical protein
LQFVNGKININNSDLILQNTATTSGASTISYIVNNGLGKVVKNISANLINFLIPIGTATNYQPITFTTIGTYAAGANVTAKINGAVHPNKPLQNTDYLNVYWPITKTGITGSVNAVANYIDASNIIGTESHIKASMYTAAGWQNIGTTNNTTTNNNGASLTTASADLYGMNTFVQLQAKAFLQGA